MEREQEQRSYIIRKYVCGEWVDAFGGHVFSLYDDAVGWAKWAGEVSGRKTMVCDYVEPKEARPPEE